MAPVAGGVADREQHRPVLGAGARERLLAPGVPVDRVLRVLEEVRAGLLREAVHTRTAPRPQLAAKPRTIERERAREQHDQHADLGERRGGRADRHCGGRQQRGGDPCTRRPEPQNAAEGRVADEEEATPAREVDRPRHAARRTGGRRACFRPAAIATIPSSSSQVAVAEGLQRARGRSRLGGAASACSARSRRRAEVASTTGRRSSARPSTATRDEREVDGEAGGADADRDDRLADRDDDDEPVALDEVRRARSRSRRPRSRGESHSSDDAAAQSTYCAVAAERAAGQHEQRGRERLNGASARIAGGRARRRAREQRRRACATTRGRRGRTRARCR